MSSDFTGSGGAAYMSDRMDWETPADLFAKLHDEFGFTLDAAARTRPSSCSSQPVQIRAGGTGISSIARRSDFYRAVYGLR